MLTKYWSRCSVSKWSNLFWWAGPSCAWKSQKAQCEEWENESLQHLKMAGNSLKVNVWCKMSVSQVYGPYYFDSLIVTGVTYENLFSIKILPLIPSLSSETLFSRTGHLHITVWKCASFCMINNQFLGLEVEVLPPDTPLPILHFARLFYEKKWKTQCISLNVPTYGNEREEWQLQL